MTIAAGRVSDTQVGRWIQDLVSRGGWAGLHYEIPLEDDPTATEAPGKLYARARVTWAFQGSRAVVCANPLRWTGLDIGRLAAVVVYDDYTGDTVQLIRPLPDRTTVARGGFELAAGELYLRFP